MLDTFKDYAKEKGVSILWADALMIISTVLIATYLSTLSHKRLGEKKEDHHGEAVRQVQRHGYFKI